MTNESEPVVFLNMVIREIEHRDSLHSKKIKKNLNQILESSKNQLDELLNLIFQYYKALSISPASIAQNYLNMVNDIRREGLYFLKHGEYSCKNQAMAYDNVYSRKDIMSYYMNALLISQVLWRHHFDLFLYFSKSLKKYFNENAEINILDVGPGHGFFSYIIKSSIPSYKKLDIVDISESSLMMTERIIKKEGSRISYYNTDIFNFDTSYKYDLIILGEVIEHLDKPLEILRKLSNLLTTDGLLWLTTPTNAPALDHVYLFRSKEEIIDLIILSGLDVVESHGCYAEDVNDEIAKKNKITQLIGAFCKQTVL